MMKIYLFTFLLALSTSLIGQGVEIYSQNLNFESYVPIVTFSYIDTSLVLEEGNQIATLKGHSTNTNGTTLGDLYNSLWEKSNELGANAYRIEEVKIKSDTTFVLISIYQLSTVQLERNFTLYPKNMVYVIGDIDKSKTAKKIKFNGEQILLKPLEFVAYQNKVGEDAIISIGGFFGAKLWVKGKVNRSPEHVSLNGFGIGPISATYHQIGISFNTGRIYPVDLDFGQFLVNVLTEKKSPDF